MLSLCHAGAVFVGQGVSYTGHNMYHDLDGVPDEQRIEFPVAEELQLGLCTGMAMQGVLTVSIFPRMDFMLRAMDALVNHLDKIPKMSAGQWVPKVIIRTRVGAKEPLDAGPQHTQHHVTALREMLTSIVIVELKELLHAEAVYAAALKRDFSTVVVENFKAC